MNKEFKLKQQAEWNEKFTLTQEQFQKLIEKKLERNAVLQCRRKTHKAKQFA